MRLHTLLSLFGAASCAQVSVQGNSYCTNLPVAKATSANLQHILQLAFGIIAVVAVLIIVIAAFQIVIAQEDSNQVAKARETIIYAAVGLAIAISAELIVSFVLGKF